MKAQEVVVGMGVVLASEADKDPWNKKEGTVLKRDGVRVRVDFGGKSEWKSAAELEKNERLAHDRNGRLVNSKHSVSANVLKKKAMLKKSALRRYQSSALIE